MKIIDKTAACVFSAAVPFILLYVLLYTAVITQSFFDREIDSYQLEEIRQVEAGTLKAAAADLVAYLKGEISVPDTKIVLRGQECNFYNDRELQHLSDIRTMLINSRKILFLGAALSILCVWNLHRKKAYALLFRCLIGAQAAWMLLMVALGAWFMADGRGCVNSLHRIFFSNELWILNPAKDRLIWLFPLDLFKDAAIILGLGLLLGMLFLDSIVFIINKKIRKRQ